MIFSFFYLVGKTNVKMKKSYQGCKGIKNTYKSNFMINRPARQTSTSCFPVATCGDISVDYGVCTKRTPSENS